jgi:hypothetical protein
MTTLYAYDLQPILWFTFIKAFICPYGDPNNCEVAEAHPSVVAVIYAEKL